MNVHISGIFFKFLKLEFTSTFKQIEMDLNKHLLKHKECSPVEYLPLNGN